jgi:hypothetical protein
MVRNAAFIPRRVQDAMSMINSQKFSCAAGQRYLLPRTILTSEIVSSVEAIIVAVGS